MSEEEKTQLRIKAAKAVGFLSGNFGYREESPDVLVGVSAKQVIEEVPNPLESDADCNALLVATMARRWNVDGIFLRESKKDNNEYGWSANVRIVHAKYNGIAYMSDEPIDDKQAAYREAVTCVCVAAWEAEKGNPPE